MRLALLIAFLWPEMTIGADFADLQPGVRSGDAARVRELLQAGAKTNQAEPRGGTVLHDAVWAGDREIVKLLLDAGADVNARHEEAGSTPLEYAVVTNHPAV